ncbi:MAG: HAD family hydrolase [Nocardioidaceae bacterium]
MSAESENGVPAGLHAVLWDMDGTLVDTEPVWSTAEFALAARHGVSWSADHGVNLVGQDLLSSGRYIREHMGLDLTAEQVVDALLDQVIEAVRRGVAWCPGAHELLTDQRRAGIPAALVTMSYRRLADAVVEALPAGTFDAVVPGDEVDNGKPHPEPYLRAASALGVHPSRCVAIEDSLPGVGSAQAAGCHVVAVPQHIDVPAAPRRTVLSSLRGLTIRDLAELVNGAAVPPR